MTFVLHPPVVWIIFPVIHSFWGSGPSTPYSDSRQEELLKGIRGCSKPLKVQQGRPRVISVRSKATQNFRSLFQLSILFERCLLYIMYRNKYERSIQIWTLKEYQYCPSFFLRIFQYLKGQNCIKQPAYLVKFTKSQITKVCSHVTEPFRLSFLLHICNLNTKYVQLPLRISQWHFPRDGQ